MNFQKSIFKSAGFTIIEILVVLAIISVIASLVGAALIRSQKRGYDARRQGDMKTYQNVLEQYYAVNGAYPVGSGLADLVSVFPGSNWPKDPSGGDYIVGQPFTANSYCICALLEVTTGNDSVGDCTYDDTTDPVYQCVSNLQ